MKQTPFLDFHNHSIKFGRMPTNGLCSHFKYNDIFKLVDPEYGEGISYWGADDEFQEFNRWYEYTSLRQTVVLLCAAINEEFETV